MSSLLAAINNQHKQLCELKQLLETELHLISSREPETLMGLLKSKEVLLAKVEEQDRSISSLYSKAVEKDQITSEVELSLDNCTAVIDECKYLTQINAKSVEQGQLKLQHLRSLVLELRSRENMTYDKSGQTRGGNASKGISA